MKETMKYFQLHVDTYIQASFHISECAICIIMCVCACARACVRVCVC
jgi:hypothetical protein